MTLHNPVMSLPIPTATEVAYASGELASSRTRRLHGSSTDHPSPTPDGFIEGVLRAGGPDLREPPCNSNHRIPPDHPYHEQLTGDGAYQLIKQAYGICKEEGLEYSGIYFCFRQSIYDTGDGEHGRGPAMTLLVDIRRGTGTHRGWVGVARRLHALLLGEGVRGVSVEIADPRFEDNLSLYACYLTDVICPAWRDLVPEIIAQVDTTGINTIGCFRIGLKDTGRSDCAPTVLLGVDYRVQRDWKSVREMVVHVLDRYNLSSVAVLIRKDSGKPSLSAAGFRNLERTALGPDECCPDPSLGSSLSAHGVDTQDAMGMFTLGGWVELRIPETGEWAPLALTCSHCCFPREEGLSAADQEVLRTWKQEGVRIGDPNAARLLSMDAPCYRDITAGVDAKESTMDTSKADKYYKRAEAARAQGESVLPGDEVRWQTVTRCLETLDKARNTTQSFVQNGQLVLGNVFAASGLREARSTDDANELSVRDWALIQPKSGRSAGDNAIRPLLSEIPHIQHLGEFQTELPQKGEEVHKIGRVSGLTHGWYSALQSCLLSNETKDGHTVARQTWEHVVTNPSGAFLELGDSGSLLFNTSGDVLGILFGASEHGDIAYFTPTRDLLQDIRSITGVLEIRMKQE